MENITTQKLENGLTIVAINLPHFHSITNMLAVRSGSRYEDETNHGIAHFLEHMGFKGTEHFDTPQKVAEAIEGVGGYSNAWTSVDHTAYWNVVPKAEYQIGVQMPFELVFRSLLRADDLKREKGVIVEEIRRMFDSPAQLVDDISQELTFAGAPLGNSVIGTEESVKALTVEQFKHYRDTHYNPEQAYFIAVGNLEGIDLKAEVLKHTDGLKSQKRSQSAGFEGMSKNAVKLYKKATDQGNFILSMAAPELALNNKERFVAFVLNSILGSGMSSRLFVTIREKKGLAYSVHSSIAPFEETGAFAIYAGVNLKKIDVALKAIEEELEKLQNELVPAEELAKAKRSMIGDFDIDSDKPVNLAMWYGISMMLGMTESREEARALIEKVTAEEIQSLSKKLFAKQNQVLSVVGPYDSDEEFKKILA